MRSKSPAPLPYSQYICCKCIMEGRGEILSLIAFYKMFLRDIKVKIFINSWYFFFLSDVLSPTQHMTDTFRFQ